jgi:hypothetical protein
MIAKKCHSIKDFFMTKIPPTLVESRYPTPNHNFEESRSPPPLAQFEATQPSTTSVIRSVAQSSPPPMSKMAPATNPFGTSENMHALAPDQAPILMHPLRTSENAYTHALAPDQASVLALPLGTLGTSENARSYTCTLAPVPNLSPRKKKSRPLQRQSRGKENWGSAINLNGGN